MAIEAAPLSILFDAAALAIGGLRGPKRLVLDTIEVDCTLNESYDFEAEVTDYEVEKGANVSDHRRLKPFSFSMTGVISDTPIDRDLIGAAIAAASPVLGVATSLLQAAGNLLAGDAIFTRDGFNKLVRLYEVGRETVRTVGGLQTRQDGTFTVATKFRSFENMVVQSLRFQRDGQTGRVLPFTATFRQIRFVETQVGQLQAAPQLQGANPLGQQGGDLASGKSIDDGKTALFRYGDMGFHGAIDRADRAIKDRLLLNDLSTLGGKAGQ